MIINFVTDPIIDIKAQNYFSLDFVARDGYRRGESSTFIAVCHFQLMAHGCLLYSLIATNLQAMIGFVHSVEWVHPFFYIVFFSIYLKRFHPDALAYMAPDFQFLRLHVISLTLGHKVHRMR